MLGLPPMGLQLAAALLRCVAAQQSRCPGAERAAGLVHCILPRVDRLSISMQRFSCKQPDCTKQSTSESLPIVHNTVLSTLAGTLTPDA